MRCFLSFLLLLLPAIFAGAQTASPSPSPTTTSNQAKFWRANLPGGTYLVALANIQSISTHEYTVEPLMRVTEFTLETNGPVVARFYFIEVATPQMPAGIGQSGIDLIKEKAEEAAQAAASAGGSAKLPWERVIKTYPTTTHAHTVEYRLDSKDDVQKLFDHAMKCWTTGKGAAISLE